MLDSEVAALLPILNNGFPRVENMSGAQARQAIRDRLVMPANPEQVGSVTEESVGPGFGVRVYRPAADVPLPVLVFAHGGGFVFCDLDTHDGLCRRLANRLWSVVVSVDYRLAPEHPYPAAAEDVYAAVEWVAENALSIGADTARIAVGGDSAGGNLAAVAALMARDRRGPALAAQILLYPVIAADFETDSYQKYFEGFYNTRAAMRWYWDQYVPRAEDRAHPYASPIQGNLAGLPPAVVVTAGHDPLRDEGQAYAEALAGAGVDVRYRCHDGAIHGFMTMPSLTIAGEAIEQLGADIEPLFG